jgi:Domain of unknown function (DUF4381)
MTAPALPDIFGNYGLGDFNEVVAPAAIDWLPQTPGWLLVFALLAFWLAKTAWQRWRSWHANRYRREAIARLEQLAETVGSDELVTGVNQLLKLTALAAWPRQQVASLAGTNWVTFLNDHCDATPFGPELAQLLGEGVYRTTVPEPATGQQLIDATKYWIESHQRPIDA